MTQRYRQIAGVLLPILAGVLYFYPGLPDKARGPLAMAVWSVLILVNRNTSSSLGPRPPQPTWDQRDAGQKLSIIMFHLMILLVAGFFSVATIRTSGGAIWSYVAAALVGTLALWAVWRNWSNRNAR